MKTKQKHQPKRRFLWILISIGGVTGLVFFLIRFWRRRFGGNRLLEEREWTRHIIHIGIDGLTEEEAEARRIEGQDNIVRFELPRSLSNIIRDNILTIFNLSLLGVATMQFILGRYLDALLSLGVALMNISIRVGQELFVRNRLEKIIYFTRPQVTVIREGNVRSIDPNEIVKGDVLAVSPGDQFMVDGEILRENSIVVNESQITGESALLEKNVGERVYAGSYCVSGRAVYRAQQVGDERMVSRLVKNTPGQAKVLTSLERLVQGVLRVMLIVVIILFSLLLVHYFRIDEALGVDTDAIVSATGVIFSLAPTGLFFMIFLNYVKGTAKLARQGALSQRARSVETLAFVTDICVAPGGIRATAVVQEDAIEIPGAKKQLSDARLRQILGDFGRSNSAASQSVRILASAYPGEARVPREEVAFLAAYGWVASVFDDDDLRGVYVLGEPQLLQPYLAINFSDEQKPEVSGNEEQSQVPAKSPRQWFGGIKRFFQSKGTPPESRNFQTSVGAAQIINSEQSISQASEDPGNQNKQSNSLRAFFKRIGKALKVNPENVLDRAEISTQESEPESDEKHEEKSVYLFAYLPEIVDLHTSNGEPHLPNNLIPLCHLHYTNEVQPEVVDTMRKFYSVGMQLKVFSSGEPDRAVSTLRQAGIGREGGEPLQVIQSSELNDADPIEFHRAVRENTVFSHATPELADRVVQTLKEDGRTVAVVGGVPSDLPAMKQANISITVRKSSQVALSVADIILLKESPEAFRRVLEEGQKIVNGLLDVLKLYITQLAYLVFLILVLVGLGYGFPYTSKQGTIIAIATLTLPSVGISFWALPGTPPKVDRLGRYLTWFVAPTSLAIGMAGMGVFLYFFHTYGEQAYARLALTHLLLVSGLVLAILIRPPVRWIKPEATETGSQESTILIARLNRKSFVLMVGIYLLLMIFAPMEWTRWLFDLDKLRGITDYLVIWLAVLAWVIAVESMWRKLIPKHYRFR